MTSLATEGAQSLPRAIGQEWRRRFRGIPVWASNLERALPQRVGRSELRATTMSTSATRNPVAAA